MTAISIASVRISCVALCGLAFACSAASAQMCPPVVLDGDGVTGYLGNHVDISEGRAVLSEPNLDRLVLYHDDGAGWYRHTWLESGVQSDGFGDAAVFDGDIMVVGAVGDSEMARSAGAVYVYRFDGSEWREEAKIFASDAGEYGGFGRDVDFDGDRIVVGASGERAIYAFEHNGSQWNETLRLQPQDAPFGVGFSVAVSGPSIAFGAYGDTSTGSLFVYDDASGLQRILPGPQADGSYFGRYIAMDGDRVVASADRQSDYGFNAGATYIYEAGVLTQLLPADLGPSMLFGSGVDIQGDVVAIGASGDRGGNGAVYMFDFIDGQWIEREKILGDDLDGRGSFGAHVALDQHLMIVGEPNGDDYTEDGGSASVYDFACVPMPELLVSPDPLIPDADATFTAHNLAQHVDAYLVYSRTGPGATCVPALDVTVDLQRPSQAGTSVFVDATGEATWVLPVPPGMSGRDVWFQVLQYQTKTNVVGTRVQ